jgi:hypothetical protein
MADGIVTVVASSSVDVGKTKFRIVAPAREFPWISLAGPETDVYFPTTGIFSVAVDVVLTSGSGYQVESDEYSFDAVDDQPPRIVSTAVARGIEFSFSDDKSGIDYENSYIVSLGHRLPISRAFMAISYDEQIAEFVLACVYDKAGNLTLETAFSSRMDGLRRADLRYWDSSFYAYASGYEPVSGVNLPAERDGLYYRLNGTSVFEDAQGVLVTFFVDPEVRYRDPVLYNFLYDDRISFTTSFDTILGYFTVNGDNGEKYRLAQENTLSRAELPMDINYITVYVNVDGEYRAFDGPFFEKRFDIVNVLRERLVRLRRSIAVVQAITDS